MEDFTAEDLHDINLVKSPAMWKEFKLNMDHILGVFTKCFGLLDKNLLLWKKERENCVSIKH